MTADDFETYVRETAAEWAFIRWITTVDKADHAVKMRLHIATECFIQVYANVQKVLMSFTLVLNHHRVYGRDCEGGSWHRHPHNAPDTHDLTPAGARAVSLQQFLAEAQQILQDEGVL